MDILEVPRNFRVESRTVRFMLYTLFALIVADGLITQYLLMDKNTVETNPFLVVWARQDMFIPFKVSGAFLATLFLWFKYNDKPKLIHTITVLSVVVYTGIIFWNLFVYLVT